MNLLETFFLLHEHWKFGWNEINDMYPFEMDSIIMEIQKELSKRKKNSAIDFDELEKMNPGDLL